MKGVFAEDFDAELDRLYQDHVAPPARARSGIMESTRAWIKARLNDVFRRRRVPQLARGIRVEEFTQPGDPMRLDYGYRNGVRGYIQAVALGRDTAQAKVLAYTAERIRARLPDVEFTAITEIEPGRDNPRHQFMVKLFDEQRIAVVSIKPGGEICRGFAGAITVAAGGVGGASGQSRPDGRDGTWATGAGGFWDEARPRHTTSEANPRMEVCGGPAALPRPTLRGTPKAPRRVRRTLRERSHFYFADAS